MLPKNLQPKADFSGPNSFSVVFLPSFSAKETERTSSDI